MPLSSDFVVARVVTLTFGEAVDHRGALRMRLHEVEQRIVERPYVAAVSACGGPLAQPAMASVITDAEAWNGRSTSLMGDLHSAKGMGQGCRGVLVVEAGVVDCNCTR
jgi:hypothetical protein